MTIKTYFMTFISHKIFTNGHKIWCSFLVCIALSLLTACGSSSNDQSRADSLNPTATLNSQSAKAATDTCNAFALEFFSPNPKIDASSMAAILRATNKYGTNNLRNYYLGMDAGADTDFVEAKAHNGVYKLTISAYYGDDIDADSEAVAFRKVQVSGTIQGGNGWRKALPAMSVACSMLSTKDSSNGQYTWLVDSINLGVIDEVVPS